ncbi:PKD domain-containing protein [Patescibacteria group bacterium]
MKNYIYKIGFLLLAFTIMANTTHAQSMMPLGENPTTPFVYNYEDDETDLAPIANLHVRNDSGNFDNYSGTTATTFTFDGNRSKDYETPGYLLEVRFDFENDNNSDTYFSKSKTTTHKYETPGIKTVKMEVLDLAGNVSTIYKQIIVVQNTPPKAYFEVTPEVGTPGTTFTFNSKASSDDQYHSNLLKYRYDFDGDGKWDSKFSTLETTKHNFKEPGLKNVILEVRDPEEASSYYRRTVYIRKNTEPKADFDVKNNDNGLIIVDSSNSYDADKSPLKYRWDFDYNGANDIQLDTTWNSSSIASHIYKKPGEYLIKLLVKDEDESIAFKVLRIFIDIVA